MARDPFAVPARAVLLLALLAGCQTSARTGIGELPPERRVPLARLVVENRTDRPLAIVVRYAIEVGGEIEVGRVPPRTSLELAPVPALEPLLLAARGDGVEWRLGPRTFEIDEVWTWVIHPDPPGSDGHE